MNKEIIDKLKTDLQFMADHKFKEIYVSKELVESILAELERLPMQEEWIDIGELPNDGKRYEFWNDRSKSVETMPVKTDFYKALKKHYTHFRKIVTNDVVPPTHRINQ